MEEPTEKPDYLKLIYEELKRLNDREEKKDAEAKHYQSFLRSCDSDQY